MDNGQGKMLKGSVFFPLSLSLSLSLSRSLSLSLYLSCRILCLGLFVVGFRGSRSLVECVQSLESTLSRAPKNYDRRSREESKLHDFLVCKM